MSKAREKGIPHTNEHLATLRIHVTSTLASIHPVQLPPAYTGLHWLCPLYSTSLYLCRDVKVHVGCEEWFHTVGP